MNNPFIEISSHSKPILFSPISNIGFIKVGEKVEYSDSISLLTNKIIAKQLLQQKQSSDSVLLIADTISLKTIQYELNNIVNGENFGNDNKKWMLPPYLDSLLMESNHSYGLVIYHNGFLRKKGNYKGQVWKAIGIGVLSMGSLMYSPQRSSSNVYLFYLDGKKKSIACIARNETDSKDPSDEKQLEKQLKSILEKK